MAEPKVKVTLTNPTLDSLALFVELADHHSLDGQTVIVTDKTYLGSGDSRSAEHEISLEVDAFMVYMPEIDHDAEGTDGSR